MDMMFINRSMKKKYNSSNIIEYFCSKCGCLKISQIVGFIQRATYARVHLNLKNIIYSFTNIIIVIFITQAAAHAQGIPTQKSPRILEFKSQNEMALSLPSDVAVQGENVYVVDGTHHRVMVYNLAGEVLFSFGSKGAKAGQMSYPVGIFAGKDKHIYLADSGNHRIQIYTQKGEYISGFEVKIKSKSVRPIDVIRHSKSGNLIVSAGNRLLTYNLKGYLLKTWGSNGVNQGEFRYPATLAELKDGRIAVVDVLNSRVQVFNLNGSVSNVVGEWGVLPGQLFRPKGVAIDQQGNFYISDSYMNVVQKYSDGGDFIAVLGEQGKPYKMLTPVGMTIYKKRLYVVEMKNNLLSVYQL
jgi:DNA-binding beta-propeller fold protein YncE